MLSASPVNSPDHRPCVLVAALSGRALAELACKAGYRPLVADLFGDMDTRRYAEAVRVLRGNLMQGPEPDDLIGALSDLAQSAEEPPIGLVCGAGFEQRPELLDALALKWPLLGCSADVVTQAKDPASLARLCAELDMPHPAIRFDAPADPECWLAKSIGGSGGWHICDARSAAKSRGLYFQKRAPGEPVCAIVVGTGKEAAIVGWSSQWIAPTPGVPYRWAGAVQPVAMEPALQALLARNAIELAVAAGIVGIASLDFVIEGSTWHLLEINPRPGGTLDIFDDGTGRLFEMHVEACRGRLIEPPHQRGAQACVIAFAARDIESMPDLRWPDWCADLQAPGTPIEGGAPVCTIRAAAASSATARRLVEQRRRALLQMVQQRELAAC
jgi:predicted ATP-grasp superfamily ATP-dependent carboligase